MRVYLVRHGETKHNVDKRIQGPLLDDPLNERGLAQARAVERRFEGERVAGLRLAAVYASPLRRAFTTAEHVARGAGTPPPLPVRALQEFSWGVYLGKTETGETVEAMRAFHQAWRAGRVDEAPPEGESPASAFARAWRDVEPILARHRAAGETVALAGHGRLFKIMLARLVAGDLSRMEEFPQGNTAVTILERDEEDAGPLDRGWRVLVLNDQSHLAGIPEAQPLRHDSGPALV